MRTRSPDNRPRDYLPRDLRGEITRLARGHRHSLSAYWQLASADAAAQALLWTQAGKPGSSPLPVALSWSDVADPTEIRWTQRRAEELEHATLIKAGESSRTAVLVAAAQAYVAAGGDMVALISAGLTLRQRLAVPTAEELWAMVTGSCPENCPLAVADTRPCWAQRLWSSGAPQSGQPAQSPDAG